MMDDSNTLYPQGRFDLIYLHSLPALPVTDKSHLVSSSLEWAVQPVLMAVKR